MSALSDHPRAPPGMSAPCGGRSAVEGGSEEGDLLGEHRPGGAPPVAFRAEGASSHRSHERVAGRRWDPRQGAGRVDGAASRLRLRVSHVAGPLGGEKISEHQGVRREPCEAMGLRERYPGP